jgi:hypothetical protein
MIGIHHAALFGKLRLQALACHGIAQEQRAEFSSSMKKQFGSLSAALRPVPPPRRNPAHTPRP